MRSFVFLLGILAASASSVSAQSSLVLAPDAFSAATVGADYRFWLRVVGNYGPYSFSITPSTVAPGLLWEVDRTAGFFILYGTPTQAGTFSFQVSVSGGGLSTSRSYKVQVLPAPTTTVAGARLFAPGNLGVGLAPSTRFEVLGEPAGDFVARFRNREVNSWRGWGIDVIAEGTTESSGTDPIISARASDGTKFWIQKNGRAGLGTSSPRAHLDLLKNRQDTSDLIRAENMLGDEAFRVASNGDVYVRGSLINTSGDSAGVSSFNGLTGAVTGVSSFNGKYGAVTGVASLNNISGAVSLAAGKNITISGSGATLTIASSVVATKTAALCTSGAPSVPTCDCPNRLVVSQIVKEGEHCTAASESGSCEGRSNLSPATFGACCVCADVAK